MGWGSSTRRGGGQKVSAFPRKFVFLGFRREESGMSREFCRDVPDPWVPRGPCDRKNSIPIKNFNPGLNISISIEIFNLDRKFQSRGISIHGALLVLQRRARSKISIHDRSPEIFNPEGRDRIFSIPGPSGCVQKACAKKVRAHFSLPINNPQNCGFAI